MREYLNQKITPTTTPKDGTDIDESLESIYQVILYNDDVNDIAYVIYSLIAVCVPSFSLAEKICIEAHESGRAVCFVDSKSKCLQVKNQLETLGLTCMVEPI